MEAEEQTIDGTGIRRRQARALRLRSPRHRRHGRAERDLRVDNVRGILIILVVIGHFLLPFSRTPLVTNLIYGIYSFHMPCFVLLSGFYAKSAFRNGHFRWGKVVQFLWLYVLYKLLVDITEGLLAGSIPLVPDFLHESGAPWYLFAISCWYLTLPLLHRFRRLSRWPLNGIVLLAILLLVVFGKYFVTCGDFLCMDRVLSFAPFFYLGYFCSPKLLGRYLASGWKRWVNLLALLLALGFLFFSYSVLYPVHLVFYGAQYTRYAPSLWNWLWLINLLWYAAALVLSLGLIGVMTSRRIGFVTKIGQRTLQVYVLHRPIRDLAQYFGLYALLDAASAPDVLLVLLLAFGVSAALSGRAISRLFQYLRTAADPFLRHWNAL